MSLLAQSTAANAAAGAGVSFLILFVIFIAVGFYFLPTLIAIMRKKANVVAIGALNTLLGWTLLGWVVSLVWSLANETPRTVIVQQYSGRDEIR